MKTNPERFISYGFLALVFFTPLIFLPQVTNLYTLPKECFLRIVISLLLLTWALKTLSSGKPDIHFSPLGLPIPLYLLALIFSLFPAINPYAATYEVLRQASYILLFFLVINHVKDEKDISNICGAAVVAGLIVSILGVFQYFTPFNPDWLYQVARPSATFGNRNMAAQYVIMMIPLSTALFLESKNQKVRLLWGVATIEMVAYVVYAHSRGAWLGLTLGGLTCLAFFFKAGCPALNWGLSPKRTSLLIFLLSIHLVLPHILPMPTKLEVEYSERVASALDLSKGSARARLAVWANTLDLIKDHPLGVGINNWKVVYPKYTRSRMIDKVSTSELHFIDAHNDYLQMIAEIGIVGFAFYLWILLYLLRICWKSPDLKYSPFFLWSILGFMATSFFSFPLKMPATSMFFWLIAGLVMANRFRIIPQSQFQVRNSQKNQSKIQNRKSKIRIFALSFLSLSLIYLFSMALFSYFQIFSDYHLQRANILQASGEIRDSLKAYTRSIELNPWSYWAYFGRGRAHYKINDFAASAGDNLQAVRLYPNDINAHGNLGLAYSEQGLFDLAGREYKEALRLYPEDRRAHYRLKELEQKKASYLKAKADYERSRASSPDSPKTWNLRGYLYFLTGAPDKAIACYKKGLNKDARYAEAYNNLANAYRKKGLFDEAIEEHKKAIKVNPTFVQAYRDLGKTYEEKGLLRKAISVYLVALRLRPDDADIHFDLGALYLTRFYDSNRALYHLTRFLQLNPDHIRAEQTRDTSRF